MDLTERSVYRTDLRLPNRREGKVRDLYDLPPGPDGRPRLLVVATDRLSAFDVVMPDPIPGKGRILTAIAAAWFRWLDDRRATSDLPPHHLLGTDLETIDHRVGDDERQRLRGRVMICRRAEVVPIECVVRGFLAGSGWSAYRRDGTICGITPPPGLRLGERLPEPVFTPTTKAASGHDEPITFDEAAARVGRAVMDRLRAWSLDLYRLAAARAERRGILLADTKFEFGFALDEVGQPTDEIILVDEILTPDSSRYWPRDAWRPGEALPSWDKQYVRDWLEAETAAGRWDKTAPGPPIPPDVAARTLERYVRAASALFDLPSDAEPGSIS